MRTHRSGLVARLTATLIALALLVTGAGCTADRKLKNPENDFATMAAAIVKAAGSDQVLEVEAMLEMGLSLKLRLADFDQWWSMADLKAEPKANQEPQDSRDAVVPMPASDVNWASLAKLATAVDDCQVWAGSGMRVMLGGFQQEFKLCQTYVAGSSVIDGEPIPDTFDSDDPAAVALALKWADKLLPGGQVLQLVDAYGDTSPNIEINGPTQWAGVPLNNGEECYGSLHFVADPPLNTAPFFSTCGDSTNRPREEFIKVSVPASAIDAARLVKLKEQMKAQRKWTPDRDHSFMVAFESPEVMNGVLWMYASADKSAIEMIHTQAPIKG